MHRLLRLLLSGALLVVAPPFARASTPRVLVRGSEMPTAMRDALGAELAAGGYRAVFGEDATVEGDDIVLEVRVDGLQPRATARRGSRSVATATLSTRSHEAAALAAASLVFELALFELTLPGAVESAALQLTRPTRGLGQALPDPNGGWLRLVPELPPERPDWAFVLEVGAVTGFVSAGGGVAIGFALAETVIVRLHGRAMAALSSFFIGHTSLSIGYLGRVDQTSFEVGVETGLLGFSDQCGGSCWNAREHLGMSAGGFGGITFASDSPLSPTAQLSLAVTYSRETFGGLALLSLSIRWSAS